MARVYFAAIVIPALHPEWSPLLPATTRRGMNKLQWTSRFENGIEKYELERSTDGVQFGTIATLQAGSDGRYKRYECNDPVNPAQAAAYYYRVKIEHADLSFRYTQVVKIDVEAAGLFRIIGNPFTNRIQVQVTPLTEQAVQFTLFTVNGQVIKKQQYTARAGTGIFIMEGLDNLSKGIYVLEAITNKQRYTWKLAKQ
ncbi:MAG: T9SS type A sorting domain-containing protein [Chitinophagaceae bacterium]|nr:T9SS type A sorting domain-containing protein [Chitinophagaceae bacterium]